jgi:hypothetical protein
MTTVKRISPSGQSLPATPLHPERDLASQRKTAPDGTIAMEAIVQASFNGRTDEVEIKNKNVSLRDVYDWWKQKVPNTKVTYEEFKGKHPHLGDHVKYDEQLRIYIPPGMRSQ